MSDTPDLPQTLLEWSAVFMRRSMHDFMYYTRSSGLSLALMNVLMRLHYHGPCEVTELVGTMQVSRAAASQMVERMVQQDLVLRVESPDDRRVRLVHLTHKGRQVVEESIAARQKWMEALMDTLSPEQQTTIASALQTLTAAARSLDKE